jgi:hypothetical protein
MAVYEVKRQKDTGQFPRLLTAGKDKNAKLQPGVQGRSLPNAAASFAIPLSSISTKFRNFIQTRKRILRQPIFNFEGETNSPIIGAADPNCIAAGAECRQPFSKSRSTFAAS